MNNAIAILKKQMKDTLKNKTVLIQFVMFPALTVIMKNAVKMDDMPENFFVFLFATMYVGMAPLMSMAAVISEEKEKNTLRVLLMSNVKPHEYLVGVGSYLWLVCMLGAAVICAAGGFRLRESVFFLLIMALGILISLLLGAGIGTWSRTQMMATSVTVPVMILFSFLPMLSLFNDTIAKVARYTYSEQIRLMLGNLENLHFEWGNFFILLANVAVFAGWFLFAYRRSELA